MSREPPNLRDIPLQVNLQLMRQAYEDIASAQNKRTAEYAVLHAQFLLRARDVLATAFSPTPGEQHATDPTSASDEHDSVHESA